MSRIAFRKATPDRLLIEVIDYNGQQLLVLAKDTPSQNARPIQILGIVLREINSPTYTWYYEYDPLPGTISKAELSQWLIRHGYAPGFFDQFGNFQAA